MGLISHGSLVAQGVNSLDTDSVYLAIDSLLPIWQEKKQEKEMYLSLLGRRLRTQNDIRERFTLATRLFEGYTSYQNDSALKYASLAYDISFLTQSPENRHLALSYLIIQNSKGGSYADAMSYRELINPDTLSLQDRTTISKASAFAFRELQNSTTSKTLQAYYSKRAEEENNRIRDTLERSSRDYISMEELSSFYARDYETALRYNDSLLAMLHPDERDFAIVAYYRSRILEMLGKPMERKYWLAKAVVADLNNAVMDQGAIWELSNLLILEGDQERAYRYLRYAWDCAYSFNTKVRISQVAPVLHTLEIKYQEKLKEKNRTLTSLLVSAVVLALLLVVAALYANRKRLDVIAAHRRLKDFNASLSDLNNRLNQVNDRLELTNLELSQANILKEEYVGLFITMCSEYINRNAAFRRHVYSELKNKSYGKLLKETEKHFNETDKETEELFRRFDAAFLNLFPNFVRDFNSLLKPEDRVELGPEGVLPPHIRIFALIRLGITESSKIAKFLNYSVNTIYSYKNRVKNAALGNRDDFEKAVSAIGM